MMKNSGFLIGVSILFNIFSLPVEGAKPNPTKGELREIRAGTYNIVAPKGWQCIDDKTQLPAKVQFIFLGTAKGSFTPSINLATEETPLSQKEYVELAKKYHEGQGETVCRSLGTVKTTEGEAHLLQIDRVTQFGTVRFIQGALVKNKTAYVITATCLHEDFTHYSTQFFKAIQSFTINPL